jgi:hypothetical protein
VDKVWKTALFTARIAASAAATCATHRECKAVVSAPEGAGGNKDRAVGEIELSTPGFVSAVFSPCGTCASKEVEFAKEVGFEWLGEVDEVEVSCSRPSVVQIFAGIRVASLRSRLLLLLLLTLVVVVWPSASVVLVAAAQTGSLFRLFG